MKSASTPERTEHILYDIANGARSKPLAQLDYYSDDALWITMADIVSMSFTKSNQNRRYADFQSLPPANEMECVIDNKEERYSPDSGGEFDGVLVRNRIVRASLGYRLNDTTTITYSHPVIADTGRVMYHTRVYSDKIYNDETSATSFYSLPGITDGWYYYNGQRYDVATYTAEGYYLSSYIDFFVYDTETLQQLKITATTDKLRVYCRAANDRVLLEKNLINFTLLGNTINGTKTFTLANITERWFQFCIVFDTGEWGMHYATDIQIVYLSSSEFFSQGIYLLDDPGFTSRNSEYLASFSARDYLKKALEINVTCPSYSSPVDVAQILRDIATRCGIPYTVQTIADTGYTVKIANADNFRNERAIDAIGEVMFYLASKDKNYRIEMRDGYLTLYKVTENPTAVDWQLHYKYNLISLDKRYVADKVLQRVTVLSSDIITDTEDVLAYQTYTAAGNDIELSFDDEALYLRIETTGSGAFSLKRVDLGGKKVIFDISGSDVSLTVTIYGGVIKNGFITGAHADKVRYSDLDKVKICELPPNSIITNVEVVVTTAFNAGGNDYLQIGDSINASRFAENIDVSSTGPRTVNRKPASYGVIDVDNGVGIYATYTPSGTSATQGEAIVRVEYQRLARYRGEAIYYNNQRRFEGFTHKIVNRLVQSDDEARSIAEALIALYGNPSYQITAEIPCNPLLEIGDNVLVWERYSGTTSIYRIDEIRTRFEANGASLYQTLVLTDTGADFDMSGYVWDKSPTEYKYDYGMLWDQDLGPRATIDDKIPARPVRFA